MKFVIDSNQLQTAALREFLSKSPNNFAVLPDFVSMEAYKGNSFETICKSMSVLSDFPRQVIVLKRTQTIIRQRGHASGLQRRLIDKKQTTEFAGFIKKLLLTMKGQTTYRAAIETHGQYANAHFEQMIGDVPKLRDAFFDLNTYTKEERALLRSPPVATSNSPTRGRVKLPQADRTIGIVNVISVCAQVFRQLPSIDSSCLRIPTRGCDA